MTVEDNRTLTDFLLRARDLSSSDLDEIESLLILAARLLRQTELSHLADVIRKQAGLTAKTISVFVKNALNYKEGVGYVGSPRDAARVFVEVGSAQELAWAWVGGSLHTYVDGVYVRQDADAVSDELLQLLGGVPAVQTRNARAESVELIRSALRNEHFFDDAAAGVNMANGFARLNHETRRLELLPHGPRWKARVMLRGDYNPGADPAPVGERFARVLPEPNALAALQEVFGAVLLGVWPGSDGDRRVIILKGPPACGKSAIIRIFQMMFPEEAIASVPPSEWGDPYARARLDGVALNVVTELGSDMTIRGAYLKKFGSREPVSARHPYCKQFDFKPIAFHVFATNEAPTIADKSDASERRVLVIPFERSLTREEIDPSFVEGIAADASSLIKWAAEGAERLMRNGRFTLPAGHLLEAAVMQHRGNVAAILANAFIERAPGEQITSTELQRALRRLAPAIGVDPESLHDGSMRELAEALRSRFGAERKKTTGRPFYRGVRFKPAFCAVPNPEEGQADEGRGSTREKDSSPDDGLGDL